MNSYKDKTVEEAGIWNPTQRMSLVVSELKHNKKMSLNVQDTGEDDLLLGASASPTAGDAPTTTCDPIPIMTNDYDFMTGNDKWNGLKFSQQLILRLFLGGTSSTVASNNYIGLVNQAMTCYLNSLLQALYMTPEFRNALYNWEFDGVNESRSIPFQLQKLFLNLQTSWKAAVETTDLTTSFGWQGKKKNLFFLFYMDFVLNCSCYLFSDCCLNF